MYRNFTEDCLEIKVERASAREPKLILSISSDYAGHAHKQALYVDGDRLAKQLEEVWKSIKTKKLLKISAFFNEIDYYDNETDIYYTPSVRMERGLRKANVSESSHGAIPKDWGYNVCAVFSDTTTVTPIIEVIKKVLYSKFTVEIEEKFTVELRKVLQKKTNEAFYYNEYED